MKADSDESPKPTPKRKLRRWLFPILAIGIGLLPLVLIELVLIFVDVGRPGLFSDPYVGFSEVQPLFEASKDTPENLETATSKRLFFGTQTFPEKKAENSYRIFCLGGSTVRGRPYETPTSFAKWLELELNANGKQTFESINCGGLSYASYRLKNILQEVVDYEPDLIVVATGHNEFLEDRTYKGIKSQSAVRRWLTARVFSLRTVNLVRNWLGATGGDEDGKTKLKDDVKARLDEESGYASYRRDDELRASIQEHFASSINAMIEIARKRKVPIVFVSLGTNLRDCPPFKSEHKPGLSNTQLQVWQKTFDQATKAEDVSAEKALPLYEKAAKIDDEYALLHYRIARCHDRMGNEKLAAKHYHLAKDWDICPLRILDPMTTKLESILKSEKIPFVDARKIIASMASGGITGTDFYVDHVHPSIRSHQIIAENIVKVMADAKLVEQSSRWTPKQRRRAYRKYLDSLGDAYFADGSRRVQWLENWARRNVVASDTFPIDAASLFRLATKKFEFGSPDEAVRIISQILDTNEPTINQRILDYVFELYEVGRLNAARNLIERLKGHPNLLDTPWSVFAEYTLATESGNTSRAKTIRTENADLFTDQAFAENRWLQSIDTK